jgi:hypothetical protein
MLCVTTFMRRENGFRQTGKLRQRTEKAYDVIVVGGVLRVQYSPHV